VTLATRAVASVGLTPGISSGRLLVLIGSVPGHDPAVKRRDLGFQHPQRDTERGETRARHLGQPLVARRGTRPGLTARPSRQILHHMVNHYEQLDRTFAALVDPTRRAILARLEREDGASVSELARPFAIKLPAVMKHLDVLDDAGLITRSKAGRTVTVRLSPGPMREAMDWLRRYERFWSGSLDRLAAYAESKEAEARKSGR